MAKLTKSALKSIVKECLVEILAEGIGLSVSHRETRTKDLEQKRLAEEKRLKNHRQKFEVKVDDTVNALTDDPIMQEIFADTAKTTLQEQMQHESRPGQTTGAHGTASAGIDLDNIFEGASSNWTQLAFSEKKRSIT